MTDLATIAYRVAAIHAPSKAILRYRDALLHAVQMQALAVDAEDRELRQENTLAAARRRLSRLGAEDRERVWVAGGALGEGT